MAAEIVMPSTDTEEISACKGCSGWEKWGKVPKKNAVTPTKKMGAVQSEKASTDGWKKWGQVPKQTDSAATHAIKNEPNAEETTSGWEKWGKVPNQCETVAAKAPDAPKLQDDAADAWEKWGKNPNRFEVTDAVKEDVIINAESSSGWEKWGKVPKLAPLTGSKDDCVSEAPTTASARTEGTAKDESMSEVPSAELTSARTSPRESPSFTPQMTPREPVQAANSALAKPENNARRRSSRVSFMQSFGLDADTDDEATGFAEIVQESLSLAPAPASPSGEKEGEGVSAVALAEEVDAPDDDTDSDDDDIYDEYDFDHTKIAEMLKAGADREKLTSAIEDAMAAALERKLKEKTADAAPIEEQPSMQADLSGQMTPGRMTPTEEVQQDGPDSETVAQHMQQAIESAQMQRRSSAAQKPIAAIAEAGKMAAEKRRASLAARMGSGRDGAGADDSIVSSAAEALQSANRRHRKSISKATEVLGDVGYGEDTRLDEVTAQMSMIEVAMEEARRRHRRSIARAVQQLEEPSAGSTMNADAQVFAPSSSNTSSTPQVASTLSASASVFEPPSTSGCQGVTNTSTTDNWNQPWEMQTPQQNWNAAPSPFQDRINGAISAAYQSHCYSEQQAYQQYDNGASQNQMWQCGAEQSYGGAAYPMQSGYQDVQYGQQPVVMQPVVMQPVVMQQPMMMQQPQQCVQQPCMQQQCFGSAVQQDANTWAQSAGNGYYEQAPVFADANGIYGQNCNQGAAWQYSDGRNVTMCGGYANY